MPPTFTGLPYAARPSPELPRTTKLSGPNASWSESATTPAATATSPKRPAGTSRLRIRRFGMLSTTAPATVRLASSSTCDSSGSADPPGGLAIGPSTTPLVNARRESDNRMTATPRYVGAARYAR